MTVKISPGNSKMGAVPSVSLPAYVTCRHDCDCCRRCYARKLERIRKSVREAYASNYRLLQEDPATYWREVEASVMLSRFFRFHVSGDIPDADYFRHMVSIAQMNFHCEILCFTKRFSIPVDAEKLACDFLSMSSHKLCGPKGVGALYVSKRASQFGAPTPLVYGGQNQESGLRGGTENVPGIVGFGRACEEAKAAIEEGAFSNVRHLYDRFINCLTMESEKYGIYNRFSHNGCSSGGKICSLTIAGVDNESLALLLGSKDICVGTGSACSSREVTPSHVLKAIGLSDEAAMSTIRVSLSAHNTLRDVKTAAQEIARCCHLLLNAPDAEGNS